MRISLRKAFGLSATAVALSVFGFAAQAQMKEAKPAAPPACAKVKDEATCRARSDCDFVAEVKDAKGKVTKKAACKAKPKPKAEKK